MSVLHEIDLSGVAAAAHEQDVTTFPGLPPEVTSTIRSAIGRVFWEWFDLHREQPVAHVHFWFFSREVKVEDLREVFTLLFGPEGDAIHPAPVSNPETPAQ